MPLVYRVDFPVTSPLPRPTHLTVNDNVLCYGPGDLAGPNQYVTMTSLQHTLFLKGGGGPGFFQYPQTAQKPQPDLDQDFFQQNDGDTQIFTFGDEGNRQGSWNSVSYPNHPELERPATRPPQTRPPPPPEPQYFPEVVTQPPPPPPRPVVQTPPPPPPQPVSSNIDCGIIAGGNERQPLIYNGQTYARGDWPWLVAIYKRKDGSLSFICSGTLVSDRHVVTAAHCMQQKNTFSSTKDIVVKVGVYNLEDWGDDVTVTRTLNSATIHESYNATSLANDILVLAFERSVEFNTNIRPACLWTGSADLSRVIGASGVVAGWGQSELGQAGRGEPRMVRVPIVSTSSCRASNPDFHKLTSDNTICAGDRNGAGPCLGDSGGGLYLLEGGRWRLRGIVSLSLRPKSGDNSCNLSEYIVFTDSAKYHGWIQNVMYST
ncbi:serine protease gd-like isoform X2 [Pectinophora gossypiella]|nr:serine protease gd-like isoform X2 [Pectinophora gossypiella]XP_049879488.1 serine protease gd-like isoform X2 [Pectinophora gossypiella]XP_049879489.1 serine protease gd-like isoform X2 [Pectinophora gossypiella]